MSRPPRGSVFVSIIGILICGVAGGFSAWMLVSKIGLDGVIGAFIAAIIGMIVATALWAAATALLRALGWIR